MGDGLLRFDGLRIVAQKHEADQRFICKVAEGWLAEGCRTGRAWLCGT